MRLLILGGTAWLGSAIAVEALNHNHEVACLARGRSGYVPDGARLIRADRDMPDAHSEVAHLPWDAVVDVARQPGQVRRATSALEPVAALYIFISSANVYADQRTPVIAIPEQWLRDHGVQPWMGPASLPLWLDDPDWLGMNARNGSRAVTNGLGTRPLEETLRDVLAWEVSREESGPHGAGLTDSEERILLAAYLGRSLAGGP